MEQDNSQNNSSDVNSDINHAETLQEVEGSLKASDTTEESTIPQDVLAKAEALKKEGNDLFKRGKMFEKHTLGKNSMMEACAKYAEALAALEDIVAQVEDDTETAKVFIDLRISILLNLAASGLALDSADSALNCCNAVLEAQPHNAKALYRRAKAYLLNKDLDKAIADLELAIRAAPKSRELREEYKRVKSEREKLLQAEAFKAETERGRQLQLEKANAQEREDFVSWVNAHGHTQNGAVLDSYAWGQTVSETTIAVQVDPTIASGDLKCEITRKHVRVMALDSVVLDKDVRFPVKVDDSFWDRESPGCLVVSLVKDNASREESPGYEWWPSAFVGEPEIDVTECNVGESLANLPDKQRREISESIEKKQADDKAREKAMKNPGKRAMYDLLREKFPDVPIDMR